LEVVIPKNSEVLEFRGYNPIPTIPFPFGSGTALQA